MGGIEFDGIFLRLALTEMSLTRTCPVPTTQGWLCIVKCCAVSRPPPEMAATTRELFHERMKHAPRVIARQGRGSHL
eukprot:452366-Pyramimonas_sp.AAC.1